jgi:hypothetical protein
MLRMTLMMMTTTMMMMGAKARRKRTIGSDLSKVFAQQKKMIDNVRLERGGGGGGVE